MDLNDAARAHGAVVRSTVEDGTGWRWRASWWGVEIGAWNDIDGVAVVADIGDDDAWVGLAGHPPDPDPGEALDWAVGVVAAWIALPGNADRIAARIAARESQD